MNDGTGFSLTRDRGLEFYFPLFEVLLDGSLAGTLRGAEKKSFSDSSGEHRLQVCCSRYRSRAISFSLQPGQELLFSCGSNLRGLDTLNWMFMAYFRTVKPEQALWIRQETSAP